MVRRSLLRSSVLLAAVAGVLLAGSAAAASAAQPVAGVDDFDFSSWDSTFEVSVDDDGRATLRAVETRVAEFPDFDQNRGIVAGFPERYRGASLQTTILSVRDENGDEVPYETEDEDDVLYVLTGDDEYVHGTTTYVIEYEMRDVILAASSTKVDEFYWDLLPLDTTQDIASFHAEIRFDPALAPHLTGDASCYQGRQGSTDRCELTANGGVFDVSARDLAAGEGITVAIALEPGTVTQPPARLPNAATDVAPYVLGAVAVLLSIAARISFWITGRMGRSSKGLVIAQYDVPDSMPPLLAGAILRKPKNTVAAQIIHLAVRGLLRLEEVPEADEKGKRIRPRLRRLDAPIPDPLDEKALTAVFGSTTLDVVMKMPRDSESFANRMRALQTSGRREAFSRGLLTHARSTPARVIQTLTLVVFAVMCGLLIWGMVTGRESVLPVLLVTVAVGILVLSISSKVFGKHTILTREGALELDYLEGVREFVRVAEADRLQMLQSHSGAERRADGTVDVIHVYERLLPYAILFGMEKEWGAVLEVAYGRAQRSAGWVDGSTASIATRIVYFNTVTRTASAYRAPSTSSSSSSSGAGGSSGGGFSGGGGGGGFSGGR